MIRRKSKYGAVRTADGFPSKLEAAVNQILHLRERAGEIKEIMRQVRVELTKAAIATKVDFSYRVAETDELVYVEAKGAETERWRIIKKLWPHYAPAPLEVWMGDYRRPRLVEVITPKAQVEYAEEK